MTELQAISRFLRRPEDQLRVTYDLIRQGYSTEFLATYRADETGQIDRESLKKIRRIREYLERVEKHRQFVKELLTQEQLWGDQLEGIVKEAGTIAEIDLLTRGLRSRKSSRALVDKQAEISKLGQAILTMEGEAPSDLNAWVAEQAGVDAEEAKVLLAQIRRWLQLLLHEEPKLLDRIARHLRRKSVVSVSLLQTSDNAPDLESGVDSELNPASANQETNSSPEVAPEGSVAGTEADSMASDPSTSEAPSLEVAEVSAEAIVDAPLAASATDSSESEVQVAASETEGTDPLVSEAGPVLAEAGTEGTGENLAFAPPRAKKPSRRKGKEPTPKAKSESNLSPRQRRRRWLRSVLEGYSKLRKPLDRLSPYQILMLGRGQRSQLIKLNLDYDIHPLIQAARESLCTGRHPLHHWLLDLAEEGLRKQILPKLEQDLMAEYEEVAHQHLLDTAVEHLENCLGQKPINGKTILAIDAIGPKSAAIAVIDPQGNVLHTDEIACNSIRGDVLTANVTMLGEISHRFHVELIALSNGPARRFLIHTVKELLKQSSGRMRWVMVDRAGADAYGATRLCLQELPSISRRHRAAVWLARRLQDPLCQLLKIDPARLRLGSYQRELPETMLDESLRQTVAEAIARRGVDVWNATESTLAHIPGVTPEVAKGIIAQRNALNLTTRQALLDSLRAEWSELGHRQALGFLRLFGSDEALDATAIHPDDYRLAQRLISNAGMPVPPNAPPGWTKPTAPPPEPVDEPSLAESTHDGESLEEGEGSAGEHEEVEGDGEGTSEDPTAAESHVDSAVASTEESLSDNPESEEGASSTLSADASGSTEETSSSSEASETPSTPAPAPEPELSIDVEKLARGWQVGRERLRYVARALQNPFSDTRMHLPDVPMLDRVPSLEDLKPGMTAWAVIIGVADFGAFADLGPDCSGLIHVSRLSSNFVEDPHQIVQVGDLLQVWVVEVDTNKKRVALSALPPGRQQRPRHDRDQESQENRRDQRGGNQRGGGGPNQQRGRAEPAGAAAGGGRRGDNRRTDDGRRDSRGRPNQAGGGGGRGGPRRGDNRNRGRRDEYESVGEGSHERKVKIDPPKPIQPISDAMQKGQEPLRSFSDLMQYFQVKREPGDESTGEAGNANGASES